MNRLLGLIVIIGLVSIASLGISIAGLVAAQAAASGRDVVAGSQEVGGKPQNLTTLTISGYGEASYVPDRAVVTFVALGYGETAAEALSKCSSKASAIFSALEDLGISRESMETSGIAVSPRYNWELKPPQIIDYEASYILTVRVSDLSIVGKVIDAAFGAGADGMRGLQFILSEDRRSELMNEAIKEAIDDAMRKAEAAASQLGLRIVRVESISVSTQQFPPPIVVRGAEMAAEAPIAPGEGEVSVSVSLTILLSG